MTDLAGQGILQRIRQALQQSEPLGTPPVPPAIDEPVTRLVHMAIGLSELFDKRAQENHMQVELVHVEELIEQLVGFLHERKCRRIALPVSPFLTQLKLYESLKEAGFDVRRTTELTQDEMHRIDCSITDVHCAVAEVGGLVLRTTPAYPRALSLLPPIHVVILKPADFVPDLVDLYEKIGQEEACAETVIITGPAQTADIGMTRVFGVNGPGVLRAFVLR
ncbi:MAG: LutC/YkgG family protein [Bacillota bacterium]